MLRIIVIVILSMACHAGMACSFAKYEAFPPPVPPFEEAGDIPSSPVVEWTIERGNNRSSNSCADTGIISLTIDKGEYTRYSAGYKFEVVESSISQEVFPEYPLYGSSLRGSEETYHFPWIDGATKIQEPVKVVLNVYRVSPHGVKSKPAKVVVIHHGYR